MFTLTFLTFFADAVAMTGATVAGCITYKTVRMRKRRAQQEAQAQSPEQIEYEEAVAERERIIRMRELHERTSEMEKGLDMALSVWDDPPIPPVPVLRSSQQDLAIVAAVQADWEMQKQLDKARAASRNETARVKRAKAEAERKEQAAFLAEMPKCALCGTSAAEHKSVNPKGWKATCVYQAAHTATLSPQSYGPTGAFSRSYESDHMAFMESLADMVKQGFITTREAQAKLREAVSLHGGGEYQVFNNPDGTKTIDFYMVPGGHGFTPASGWKVIDKQYETYATGGPGRHIRYRIERDPSVPLYTKSMLEPEMPEIHVAGEAVPIAARPATLITLPYPMTAQEAAEYKAEYVRRMNDVGTPMIMPSSTIVQFSDETKQTLRDAAQVAKKLATEKVRKVQ